MGKGASKLKRKSSIQNLTWSKFGSLPLRSNKSRLRKENAFQPAKKHKDVSVWLRELELEEYQELFKTYQGVEDLLEMSEQDIKELGVKKSSHRARIISSLTYLRAKYHENIIVSPIRHSVAVDSRSKLKRDDTLTDLRVVSEAVPSKSLNNLIMEPMADPGMNAAELRKALEWELSLDSRDLRSHAWYHGAIPRVRAEEIVREEGEFLIRDCTSQPGNYVLSCRTKTHPIHFVINKIILQPDTVYERVQYQFEDDAFDTVPDLITYYVGSGKPITIASGARIQVPKNRMYPLSFYASKYPTPLPQSRLTSPASTPVNRISQEKCNSADGIIQSPLMTRSAGADSIGHNLRFSSHSLPRNSYNKLSLSSSANTLGRDCRSRVNSDNTLSPCSERQFISGNDSGLSDSPPPKPSRVPSLVRTESKDSDVTEGRYSVDGITHGGLQRVTSYHASGSDSGNGSGDSAMSSVTDTGEVPKSGGVIIKNPRYNMSTSESSTTLKNFEIDCASAEEKLFQMALPECDLSSRFDLENFQTLMLPVHENKPLDAQALRKIKMTLFESGPRILANHLTRTDLDLIFGTREEGNVKSKLTLGINLCALPHGHQFRMDLIERTECLKLLVAVTILTCADESERTDTLNKWIEIAIDTKTALGNLFGFCGIMLGLCLPQIERLNTTWHMLRQKYTDSAFNFEAKLRPTLKNMNSCSNPQAPNTTIPHLLPLILLLERNLDDFLASNDQNQLSQITLGFWEWNTQDFGIGTLLNHMETARKYLELCPTYQRNAEIVLGEARTDELTLDIFRTEFQLKFLWGSRGAFANSAERHSKFDQVLTVMAEKYCNFKNESEV
ncbi:breast cancer anti-estrogen resistance protein 3 homolog isoform X3 [Diorhabda sublineata]|uniref:breast cancer anti-estrogen resistance protein 3 homolog isoform X3 n=1 Tax=Diorhabda sublineata TaxID=1163346 RepID=UPI0024E14CB8|nr:breast cancer anti-estrogen resistance protein 3 homolog isoform X3 [Diorhabda sublineata]